MSNNKQFANLVSKANARKEKEALKNEIAKEFESRLDTSQPKFKYTEGAVTDTNTPIQKMVETPVDSQENPSTARELQLLNDNILITSVAKGMHPSELVAYQKFYRGDTPLAKALATTVSGSGSQWIPTQMSASFIEEMIGEYKLASEFETIPIPQGVGSVDIPGGDANIDFYKRSDTSEDDITAYTSSTPTSRKVTLTPVELAARVQYSTAMTEDAAFNVANWIRGKMIAFAAKAIDDALVNGDENAGTSSAIDSDMQQSADAASPRAAWDGIRVLTPTAAKIDANDVVDVPTFRKLWMAMVNDTHDYSNENEVMIVCNRNGYLRLLTMLEINNTNDDRLMFPENVSGKKVLPNVYGIPIVVTSAVRRDLNESGVYDGSTTDETQILLVNKKSFVIGDKRKVTVEVDKNIKTGRFDLVCTVRMDFQGLYPSTEPAVAYLYDVNITT